jgi:hypothetical protein
MAAQKTKLKDRRFRLSSVPIAFMMCLVFHSLLDQYSEVSCALSNFAINFGGAISPLIGSILLDYQPALCVPVESSMHVLIAGRIPARSADVPEVS